MNLAGVRRGFVYPLLRRDLLHMPKSTGYGIVFDPDAKGPFEFDTITCNHCQQIVRIKPGSAATVYYVRDAASGMLVEDAGAFCRVCMAPICLNCHDSGGCTPWEKKMEEMEARGRFLKSVGLS